MPTSPAVLLYDGTCGFCDATVKFVLGVDHEAQLRFAPLDGDFAAGVIARHPELAGVDSVVYVMDPGGPGERVSVRSDAALHVADYLGGPWRALGAVARVIPAPIRDWSYDRFAAVRYRLFGRVDSCALPPPEVRARFVG